MASNDDDSASVPVNQTQASYEDDILVVRMSGLTGAADLQKILDMSEALFQRHGYILQLIDAKGSKGFDAAARRLNTERLKTAVRPSYASIYNVSAIGRVVITLMQRGIALVAGKTFDVGFYKDEAEARAQLAARRVLLVRNAAASHT